MHRKRVGIALVCMAALPAAAVFVEKNSLSAGVGICIRAYGECCLAVLDGGPVILNRRGGGTGFSGLEPGDRILVVHDGMDASYPGRTGALLAWKLPGGGGKDVPEALLQELRDLGWLSGEWP